MTKLLHPNVIKHIKISDESGKVVSIMRLSILCPTTPPTGLGGARWGFVILASTKAPPLGATLADKSPLIPSIGGGAAVGKWGMEKNMVQYEPCYLETQEVCMKCIIEAS